MSFPPARPHASPAAEAAALLCRIGLALLGIAVPAVAMGTRRAMFVLMPVGAALILVAALLDSRSDALVRLRIALASPLALAALFLLGWAVISCAWAPFRPEATARFAKEAGTLVLAAAVCAFMPERTRVSNMYLWPVGAAIAAVTAIVIALAGPALLTVAQDGENSTLERGLLALTVLLWPALGALALRGRWNAAGALAILAALASISVWSAPGLLALIAGALVFALAVGHPGRAAYGLGGFFAMLLLVAPGLPVLIALALPRGEADGTNFLGDAAASIRVWADIVHTDKWRLLTGHGIDSATRGVVAGLLPARAPDGLLYEVWFELGALGALAAAVLVYQAFLACARQSAVLAPFLIAGLSSFLVIAVLGFSLSQLWWVTMAGIIGIGCVHVQRGQYLSRRPQFEPERMRAGSAQQA